MDIPVLMCPKCGMGDNASRYDNGNEECECQQKPDTRIQKWPQIMMRVQRKTRGKPVMFQLLCLALAKYDFFGGPSDWSTSIYMKHRDFQKKCPMDYLRARENFILRWARWVIREKREYFHLIREYLHKTRIPDCIDLLIDFCTWSIEE